MRRHSQQSAVAVSLNPQDWDQQLDEMTSDVDGFLKLADLLRQWAGIDLQNTPKNLSLMASRLRKVIASHGLQTYDQYYGFLLQAGAGSKRQEFISALTTNTTQFFREREHFDELTRKLGDLWNRKRRSGQSELRVWCAAASTGQEPYTILMTILEALGEEVAPALKFLATDIDLEVLARAAQGEYQANEVNSLPGLYVQKYFESRKEGSQKVYRVRDQYQKLIRFAQFNLIQPSYPFQHRFDIVFCRNVLIYFDSQTAMGVVEKLAGVTSPGGLLFVGHSECGLARSAALRTTVPAAYERLDDSAIRSDLRR